MKKLTDWLLSIILMLGIISISVVVVLNFRGLYYFDIDYLNIPTLSGYTKEQILQNYNHLIDYNSMFYQGPLNFPSMGMSSSGRSHFEEVKEIFVLLQQIAIITTILGSIGIVWKLKQRQVQFFKYTCIITIILPMFLGVLIALNWEKVFTLFHKITFSNDDWLFDPITDPVINILPSSYFMHCAIMILLGVVLGSAVCGMICWKLMRVPANRLQERYSSAKFRKKVLFQNR